MKKRWLAVLAIPLAACVPPQDVLPDVDVVGDSTLQMAQAAAPIENARGFWGTSPGQAAPQLLANTIVWVYAGTNIGNGVPGPEDDVQIIRDACEGKVCVVTLQGVDLEYDRLVEESGLRTCDLRPLNLWRYDGVHTDEASTKIMAGAIQDCVNGIRWITTGRVTR